jgi:hypothetical protein
MAAHNCIRGPVHGQAYEPRCRICHPKGLAQRREAGCVSRMRTADEINGTHSATLQSDA